MLPRFRNYAGIIGMIGYPLHEITQPHQLSLSEPQSLGIWLPDYLLYRNGRFGAERWVADVAFLSESDLF